MTTATKDDSRLVMDVLSALEGGTSARAITSQTTIPKLIVNRVKQLHLHRPTLLIRIARGEMSITEAFKQMKEASQHADRCL